MKYKCTEIGYDGQDLPSPEATQIANNLSNLGQIYNREDLSTNVLVRRKASNNVLGSNVYFITSTSVIKTVGKTALKIDHLLGLK